MCGELRNNTPISQFQMMCTPSDMPLSRQTNHCNLYEPIQTEWSDPRSIPPNSHHTWVETCQ
jgi:hypothetical protein